jgi:hypothetical protein
MNSKEQKIWKDGDRNGRNSILCELYDQSDKPECLMALFRKANMLSCESADPIEKAKLQGYSEGMRHAINILDSRGAALEAFQTIMRPDPSFPLTEEEIASLGSTGH